jgi:IrrE N-terminal-like domain
MIPSTIRIGSAVYQVVLEPEAVKAASGEANFADKNAWIAFSDHEKLIIGLNPEHASDANRFSLIHEILHCALRQSGSHPNTYADTVYEARDRNGGVTVEEYTVSAMTGPLLSTLRDNPDVVAYLTS